MATAAVEAKIDIGRVVSRGFEALGRNVLLFFACALLLAGLPSFLTQFYLLGGALGDGGYWGIAWLLTMSVSMITGYILQVILVRSTILTLSGRDADFGNSLAVAGRLLLPMIALAIVSMAGIGLGLVLLIVPGIILYLMWIVAVPAMVEERRGVVGSLKRSAQLTKGSRGRIFLLVVIWFVLWGIVSAVFSALFGVTVVALDGDISLVSVLVQALTGTITATIAAVMVAALYVELRSVKEGASTESLAAIFE